MYPLPTALLNEHAHVADFWPVLPIIPCLCACLPCLLRQKLKKIKNTQNVVQEVANAAQIRKFTPLLGKFTPIYTRGGPVAKSTVNPRKSPACVEDQLLFSS